MSMLAQILFILAPYLGGGAPTTAPSSTVSMERCPVCCPGPCCPGPCCPADAR